MRALTRTDFEDRIAIMNMISCGKHHVPHFKIHPRSGYRNSSLLTPHFLFAPFSFKESIEKTGAICYNHYKVIRHKKFFRKRRNKITFLLTAFTGGVQLQDPASPRRAVKT